MHIVPTEQDAVIVLPCRKAAESLGQRTCGPGQDGRVVHDKLLLRAQFIFQ